MPKDLANDEWLLMKVIRSSHGYLFLCGMFTYTQIRDQLNRRLGKVNHLRPLFEFAQGLDFGWRYFRHRKWGLDEKRASTREVYVEWVNYCNLRCRFCALDHQMQKERMSEEVWRKVLEEVFFDPRFSGVEVVHLHNGGETLLHPKAVAFLEILDELYQKAQRLGGHIPRFDLLTNGLPLTPAKEAAILKCRAIRSVGFSMDGGSPEAYEAIRVRGKWDAFSEKLESLAAANAKLAQPKELYIISVLANKAAMQKESLDPAFKQLLNVVDSYELRLAHDWGGQVEVDGQMQGSKHAKPWKWGCSMMMDQLVVLPGGEVSICCNDLNGVGKVGNVMDGGLFAAYSADQRLEWLNLMAKNQTQSIPLCRDCERF